MQKQNEKKIITGLSLASFLHDVGSDMVFSIWPLFVTQVLGANMAILGLIDGIGDAIVSISGAVGGYISDRVRKRKIFVWTGYLFGGISRVGYALSPTWQWLIPFRLLDRSGKIRGAPRDAILSDISTAQNRGGRFGILRAMDNTGAVIGILIAIIFLPVIGFRNLFFLAAIPSAFAILIILILIKEPRIEKKLFKGVRFKDFNPNLKLLTFASAIFAFGSFSYSFLLLFSNRFGFSTFQVPILYLVFTVFAAITSIPFGKLSDKIGRKNVLYLSYAFWTATLVLLLTQNILGIILAFVFYGFHKGAIDPVQKTFVAELAPSSFVASTLGAFQMVIGIIALPASFLAGVLWDAFNPFVPFYISLGLTILSGVLLVFVKENER